MAPLMIEIIMTIIIWESVRVNLKTQKPQVSYKKAYILDRNSYLEWSRVRPFVGEQ